MSVVQMNNSSNEQYSANEQLSSNGSSSIKWESTEQVIVLIWTTAYDIMPVVQMNNSSKRKILHIQSICNSSIDTAPIEEALPIKIWIERGILASDIFIFFFLKFAKIHLFKLCYVFHFIYRFSVKYNVNIYNFEVDLGKGKGVQKTFSRTDPKLSWNCI